MAGVPPSTYCHVPVATVLDGKLVEPQAFKLAPGCGKLPVTVTEKSAFAGPPVAGAHVGAAQLMLPVLALVQAKTVSGLLDDGVTDAVGAAPFQSTFVSLTFVAGVGTPGMLKAVVQLSSSTAVLVDPTRSKISLGTVTVSLTFALAETVPVPADE